MALNLFQLFTIFAKRSISDVWQGPEYASVQKLKNVVFIYTASQKHFRITHFRISTYVKKTFEISLKKWFINLHSCLKYKRLLFLLTWYLVSDHGTNHSSVFEGKFYCVKSALIRRFSSPYFPTFGLNTEIYSIISVFCSNARKCRPSLVIQYLLKLYAS